MEYVDGVDFLKYVRGDPVTESDDQETLSSLFTTIEITPGSPPQQTFRSFRALERPDQFARLRRALPQLVEGVQTLHEAGKLHRDLKPSNVLVTREGRVAILDFGLVTDLPGTFAGREGSIFSGGTRGYMSPEQVRAQDLTPASDWYTVGVMLYQTLMGGLPSSGAPPFSRLVPPALRSLCMRLLALAPEARPRGPEILRSLGEAAPSHHQAASVFVGRAEQYAALESALKALREGNPRAIYISGPSGMGKSELVRRFIEQAAADKETLILTGTCREQESVPYKALDGVIDSLSRFLGKIPAADRPAILPRDTAALARAFPVLRSVITVPDIAARAMESADPLELRRRVSAALRDLFGRLGDRMPVVIYIDDLQWGDIDSAALLAELMSLPDAPLVLLIATYRSESAESSAVLQTLFAGARESSIERREITLGPLSLEETESLVESRAGRNRDTGTGFAFLERGRRQPLPDSGTGSGAGHRRVARAGRDHARIGSLDARKLARAGRTAFIGTGRRIRAAAAPGRDLRGCGLPGARPGCLGRAPGGTIGAHGRARLEPGYPAVSRSRARSGRSPPGSRRPARTPSQPGAGARIAGRAQRRNAGRPFSRRGRSGEGRPLLLHRRR